MTPTQTALIVAVPEVEHAVGAVRARLDRSAGWGVPAHVTVLYPFLPLEQVDDEVVAALARTVATVPRFDVTFTHIEWFADAVVWLAPRPDDGFRALTAAVWRQFPATPPYAGAHDDVVPHLTLGHDAATHELTAAAAAVAAHLPIGAAVEVVRLIAGTPGPDAWHTVHEFPLSPRS